MSNRSTREHLLSIIDDIEIITKQILENVLSVKHQKTGAPDQEQLTKLLIEKSDKLMHTMELAEKQAKLDQIMSRLKDEVDKHDQYIRQFEKQLKDAEQLLSTANFQAKQKLESINKANQRPVPSEELIKYAHRISSSEAVCAPLSWQPGDTRRPYPTEIDMRLGLLTRYNDPPNGHMIPPTGNLPDIHRSATHPGPEPPVSIPNQFSWHPTGDIHIGVSNQSSVTIDTRNHHKDAEDVEVMSTDSSSSSSSDSQ